MKIRVETSNWGAAPKPCLEGQPLFAIGDVHGYAENLEALHDHLRKTIQDNYDPSQALLVWLGDYVDRGPDPLACLDLVNQGLGLAGLNEVRLRGNHDSYLMEALSNEDYTAEDLKRWVAFGGGTTIRALTKDASRPDDNLPRLLREKLGEDRVTFLNSLTSVHRSGSYVFAHAGINPERPLEEQRESDLMMIRDPFLNCENWPYDFVVVHGHTPEGPEVTPHRICVDSGVYFSGKLTAVEIAGGRHRFHTAVAKKTLFSRLFQ